MNENGRMKNQHVELKDEDREYLDELVSKGELKAKINWQFSLQSARSKLNSHYVKIHPENTIFKIT